MMHGEEMRQRAQQVQDRLEILWGKLEGEGSYVSANTAVLAQELIRELTGIGPRRPLQLVPAAAQE